MRQLVANDKVKSFITAVLAIAIAYPVINLLRTQSGGFVDFKTHLREIIFFILTLFLLIQAQLYINRWVAGISFFKSRHQVRIILSVIIALPLVPLVTVPILLWLFPRYAQPGADPRTIIFFTMILLLLLLCFLFNYHFKDYLRRFEQSTVTQEKLRYEKMLAQYKSLQNQVSPHFLFNCLNDLNSLIHTKPQLANDVVLVLSDTLRYIIANQEKILVDLRAEMEFLNNYLFLQLLRSPGSIRVSFNVEPGMEKKAVPPATLQILVENAIKHNSFSTDNKLLVSIKTLSGNRLEISNSISATKGTIGNGSTRTGLKNILERYSFLTDTPVSIQRNAHNFTVTVPLIEN